MAEVGYIFIATNGVEYAEDKAWMQQYGCVQVIEELSEHLEQREQSRTCSDYAESRQRKTIVNTAFSLCPRSYCSDASKRCGGQAEW